MNMSVTTRPNSPHPTEEQERVILCDAKNVLVSARAGTGKTFTMAKKVQYLIEQQGVNPDEILVLTFNNIAAMEIQDRINMYCGRGAFSNARTFDSLANKILETQGRSGEVLTQKKETEALYKNIFIRLNETISLFERMRLYLFLNKEKVTQGESYESLFQTLNGDDVKSKGEQMIANFMFEHGVPYKYEPSWQWDGKPYNPDFQFTINGKTVVWEHWAIDPNKRPRINTEKKSGEIDEQKYYDELTEKKAFWNREHPEVVFFETSTADMDVKNHQVDEKHFYTVIQNKLSSIDIHPKKLTIKELAEKIYVREQKVIVDLFDRYIKFAQAECTLPEQMEARIAKYQDHGDHKVRCFLEFANKFYALYTKHITDRANNIIDFHQRKIDAVEVINMQQGDCSIVFRKSRERSSNLKNLKWILIDEY